jgi:hypothetical protein
MFGALRQQWQMARAAQLRPIAEDLAARIANLQGEPLNRFIHVVAVEMDSLLQKTADFKNVSNDGLKRIAKSYFADAKASYDLDVGGGAAKALIATLLEAMALPGNDAIYVKELTEGIVALAIKQCAPNANGLKVF